MNDRCLTAVATAMNFLSVFLGKCGVKNNEEVDYRPLFENFVQVQDDNSIRNDEYIVTFCVLLPKTGFIKYSQ